MTDPSAPFGYHPGTKIPRKAPRADEYQGRGTCKYCGEQDLVWELQPSGWRLVDVGGKRHVCKKYGSCLSCGIALLEHGGFHDTNLCGPCCTGESRTYGMLSKDYPGVDP